MPPNPFAPCVWGLGRGANNVCPAPSGISRRSKVSAGWAAEFTDGVVRASLLRLVSLLGSAVKFLPEALAKALLHTGRHSKLIRCARGQSAVVCHR